MKGDRERKTQRQRETKERPCHEAGTPGNESSSN